jgi:hypothetical protein
MKTQELKIRLAREILALDDINKGLRTRAIQEIQLGELSDEQLKRGLTARLTDSYYAAFGRRIPSYLLAAAVTALGGATLPPNTANEIHTIIYP